MTGPWGPVRSSSTDDYYRRFDPGASIAFEEVVTIVALQHVLHVVFPSYLLPWINLLIIVVVVVGFYRLFTHTKIAQSLTSMLRKRIAKRKKVKPVSFEELVVATQGYGVSSIEIGKSNPLIGKTIKEAKLRGKDINILAVEKGDEINPK